MGSFDLDVYGSDSVWPRAFFTDTLSSYESPSKFVEMVKAGDGNPFAAVTREDLIRGSALAKFLGDQTARHIVSASDYQLTNNTTSFRVVVQAGA